MDEWLRLLGATTRDLFFQTTRRGEANFQVLLSTYIDFIRETGRTQLLSSVGDHPSILKGIKRLEKLQVIGKMIPINTNGQVTKAALEECIRPRSALVSLSWANDLTGVIQPIHDLISLCREKDLRIHIDATSVIGKLYFQFSELEVEFLTLPNCVIAKQGIFLSPLYFDEEPLSMEGLSDIKRKMEQIDQFCLETARLRDLLEGELSSLLPDATLFFREVDRLPNYSVLACPGIHAELLLSRLRGQKIALSTGNGRLSQILLACGVSSLLAYSAISIEISDQTTEADIFSLVKAIQIATTKSSISSQEEAAQKGMRLAKGSSTSVEGNSITYYLLVDENDGMIADCKWVFFGPPELELAAEATAKLLLRKRYPQAKHFSAELIETLLGKSNGCINLVIDAVDEASSECMDIPLDEQFIAPEAMTHAIEEAREYPNWELLSSDSQKKILEQLIATDIRPYIELDAGNVQVLQVEHPHVRIVYQGACTSCYSATGATLDAIQGILRNKIHPNLIVIPDLTSA